MKSVHLFLIYLKIYGEELEEVQNKIKEVIANIEKLSKQKESLEDKALDASNKLFEYEQQIGYYD